MRLNSLLKKISSTFILFLFITIQSISADEIIIKGKLSENTRFAHVILNKFEVTQHGVAIAEIKNDAFELKLPQDILPGVYRLQFSRMNPHDYIDIIINGLETNIEFKLNVLDNQWWPEFVYSEENKRWYAYLKQSGELLNKINVKHHFLSDYPNANAKIFKAVYNAHQKSITEYKKKFNTFVKQNKGTFAGEMVANQPTHFSNPRDLYQLQVYDKRINYWKNVNTTNPELINTPLYTEHILNYVSYYMNPDMNFTEKEMIDGFKNSVDTIMKHFSGNELTKRLAIQYLTMGFKEIGLSQVLQYLDVNYNSPDQCETDEERASLQRRLESYEVLRKGERAPEIKIEGIGGLAELPHDTLIVVFWAAWCPHCTEALPVLNAAIKNHPNIGVLGVSLDEDETGFNSLANRLNNFIHYVDYQGWNSPVAQRYFVYATPTYHVLDGERRFVETFSNVSALMEWLSLK